MAKRPWPDASKISPEKDRRKSRWDPSRAEFGHSRSIESLRPAFPAGIRRPPGISASSRPGGHFQQRSRATFEGFGPACHDRRQDRVGRGADRGYPLPRLQTKLLDKVVDGARAVLASRADRGRSGEDEGEGHMTDKTTVTQFNVLDYLTADLVPYARNATPTARSRSRNSRPPTSNGMDGAQRGR